MGRMKEDSEYKRGKRFAIQYYKRNGKMPDMTKEKYDLCGKWFRIAVKDVENEVKND